MGQTGIQWGGWSGKVRLGINVRWDDVNQGTGASNVYVDYYYGTNAWGYASTETLSFNGGAVNYSLSSGTGQSVTTLIYTWHIGAQGTSYGGGPSWTFSGSTSPAYDGSAPSVSVGFTLPARPADPPSPPAIAVVNITSSSASVYCTAAGAENGATTTKVRYRVHRNWDGALIADLEGGYGGVNYYGLDRNTGYVAYAQSYNAAGWGGWSAGVGFNTLPTAPDAGAAPTVSDILPDGASISWAAPNNGGSGITGYDVQVATDAGYTANVQTVAAASVPKAITGLGPGLVHYVRWRAKNAYGAGAWSASTIFTTLTGAQVKLDGAWLKAKVWVKVDGTWRLAKVWKKVNGTWRL